MVTQLQFDPVQLGFTFAKELATQLISLSTGILALSVTFAKDVLKTPLTNRKETLLRIGWGGHLLSISLGVWTLMALTGTLMPLHGRAPNAPWELAANVRCPAALQVILFVAGTILLVFAYVGRS